MRQPRQNTPDDMINYESGTTTDSGDRHLHYHHVFFLPRMLADFGDAETLKLANTRAK